MSKMAVIYYSATGNVHALAQAVAKGAAGEGAEVRIRGLAELAPRAAIDTNPVWRDATTDVQRATTDDVGWADGLAFGTPTRFGNISAQLKQFLDIMGPLWAAGELANKAGTGFMSSAGGPPGPGVLEAASHQGRRLATITQMIAGGETAQCDAA